jgi:hypothetical protein
VNFLGVMMKKIVRLMVAFSCALLVSYQAYAEDTGMPVLNEAGLQGINANTEFDVAAIQALFPRDHVQLSKSMSEGQEFKVMVIAKDSQPYITILPTADGKKPERVLCLAFNSNKAINSLGVAVGDTYQSVYRNQKKSDCVAGMEESSGEAICAAPNGKSIYYIFHGKWDGVDGVIPPQHVLNKWTVKEIIWLADITKKDILAQFCRSDSEMSAGVDVGKEPLASAKIKAYDATVDAPLLKKLKNDAPLNLEDKARMEVLYQAQYVGEEKLTPVQEQIATYAKKMLSSEVRKQIENRADSQGM